MQNFVCHSKQAGSLAKRWAAGYVVHNKVEQLHLSPGYRNLVGCPLVLPLGSIDLGDVQGSLLGSCIGFVGLRENSFQLIFFQVRIFVSTLLTSVVIELKNRSSTITSTMLLSMSKTSACSPADSNTKWEVILLRLSSPWSEKKASSFSSILSYLYINSSLFWMSFSHLSFNIVVSIRSFPRLHIRGRLALLFSFLLTTVHNAEASLQANINLGSLSFDILQAWLAIISRDVPGSLLVIIPGHRFISFSGQTGKI